VDLLQLCCGATTVGIELKKEGAKTFFVTTTNEELL